MSFISKEELERAYKSGKSMWEISQGLGCSVHKVVYWMNKYDIARRTWSEASYVKLNPGGDPFLIKQELTFFDQFLLGLGLGIYFGEGEKVSRHGIRVANTNVKLIKTFRAFLEEICGVSREKIKYSIICFNDTTPSVASNYWSKELGISNDKFGKIVQIPPQGKGTYKRKSLYGVCTISVSNIKLKQWLMSQLEGLAFADIV